MRIVGSQCENQAENRPENQVTQWELPNTAVYIYLCGASLWLGNNRRFQVFEKKSEWTNRWFQFQNKFKWELKNARLQAFERIRDERTAGFSYWKILKEPTGLLNEPAKNWQFSGWLFDFNVFLKTTVIDNNTMNGWGWDHSATLKIWGGRFNAFKTNSCSTKIFVTTSSVWPS